MKWFKRKKNPVKTNTFKVGDRVVVVKPANRWRGFCGRIVWADSEYDTHYEVQLYSESFRLFFKTEDLDFYDKSVPNAGVTC